MRLAATVLFPLLALAACGSDGSGSLGNTGGQTGNGGSTSSGATSDLTHCIDVLNSYRAQVHAPAIAESSALESFAAAGAESDSQTGQAHGHFGTQGGASLVAYAENEIPGWPLAQYGSVSAIIDQGMQMMFAEGPGGGHYDNMTSTKYTQAGCGIYVTASNDVWITTDFR